MKVTPELIRPLLIKFLYSHSEIEITLDQFNQPISQDLDSLDIMEINMSIEESVEVSVTTVFILDDVFIEENDTYNNWVDKICFCVVGENN